MIMMQLSKYVVLQRHIIDSYVMTINPKHFARDITLIVGSFYSLTLFFQIKDSEKPAVATTKTPNHLAIIDTLIC